MLKNLDIDLQDFIQQTGSTIKLGFRYEKWKSGKEEDFYYHLFPTYSTEMGWLENGYYPYLSLLLNQGLDVSSYMDSMRLCEKKIPQKQMLNMLMSQNQRNFGASLHFDTFRVGQYLKKVALSRGIVHVEGFVQDFDLDAESGNVTAIKLVDREIKCDFLIDASGFARLVIGKKYQSKWHSLADTLVMNKALPFHLPHETENIELVTRATAMNAGWVWQIPLQERIGAGYVYNDNFISDDEALDEVQKWLGKKIQPVRTIKFEAGYYEKVWINNVIAVGLASGFVEPLEATSIGQMLHQLETIALFVIHNHGVVSQKNIDYFNAQNAQFWHGIGDFIRMHYDTGRSDTPFWQYMLNVTMSEDYKELKKCWQHRTPRQIDFAQYRMNGGLMFDVPNWLAVGVGVGIIKPEATAAELMVLSTEQKQKLAQYLLSTKKRRSEFKYS